MVILVIPMSYFVNVICAVIPISQSARGPLQVPATPGHNAGTSTIMGKFKGGIKAKSRSRQHQFTPGFFPQFSQPERSPPLLGLTPSKYLYLTFPWPNGLWQGKIQTFLVTSSVVLKTSHP